MSNPTNADDRPAVTGAPLGGESRKEAITGDDSGPDPHGGNAYPADEVSPDRGSSAPRD